MKQAFSIVIVLLLFFSLPLPGRAKDSPPTVLALVHVTIIDMTGAPAKPDMTVIITGDHITRIDNTSSITLPKRAQRVDATGKFLIPGLWDMHIHSGGYENGKKYFPLLIAKGIVGVRDMGTPLEDILRLRKEINHRSIIGPHLVIAGPLVQGPLPFQDPILISVHSESEARQTVRSLKQAGVDFIKVHDSVPRNIYFAIAAESKRQGIPLAGHVPPSISAAEATNAGQRSIEHLGGRFYGVLLACSSREDELTERMRGVVHGAMKELSEKKEPDDSEIFRATITRPLLESFSDQKAAALFSAFIRNNTWQVPTLIAQPLREAINGGRKDLNATDLQYGKMLGQKLLDVVGAMKQAGVGIMAGTDSSPQKSTLHDELSLLVEAGLTPMEALQTATRNPAEFLGSIGSSGTVENGKIADLVLLDANPLEEIHNTQKISAVILGGRIVHKASLQLQ